MVRPYWTVLVDAFHEALVSRVLWILLIVSTLLLLALAPLGLREERSVQLHVDSIRDWPALIARLKHDGEADAPSPGKHLWELADDDFRKTVDNALHPEEGGAASHDTVPRLLGVLNQLLANRRFYDAAAWHGIEIDSQTAEQLKKGLDQLPESELIEVNRQLLQAAFPAEVSAIPEKELWFSYFGSTIGKPLPLSLSQARPAISHILAAVMDFLVGTVAVFIAILVTAPMIPQTFEAGAIDLLLSKPIARPLLFLVKFLGGCAFILLNAGYLILGLWLILGLRFGIWNHALLWCIPLFLFLFAIYYSVSALAGVLWRNATVSIVLTILFWAACFTVETAKGVVEQFFVNPTRLVSLVPTDEALVAVNQSGEFLQWHSDDWEPIHQPKQGGPPFGMNQVLIGPLYDAEQKELLYIQRPAGGRFRFLGPSVSLNKATWAAGAWTWSTGPSPPSGSSWLFRSPQGETILLASGGVYRLDEQAGQQHPAPKVLGFTLPFGGEGPYLALGPKPSAHWKDSCAAAMHPVSGDLVVYDSGTLSYLRRDAEGHYARGPERSWDATDGSAVLAFAGPRIVVAQADGRILLLNAETLQTEMEWSPAGKNEPYQAKATPDGRWFTVLFHNGTLALFDAEGKTRTTLGGAISAASFEGNQTLLAADRAVRVTKYHLTPLRREQSYAPSLDALQATYRYFLLPFYTLFPKPGKLSNVVNYLLTQQETVATGPPTGGADLRQTRVQLDVAGPFWSSLAFMAVVLGLTCLYLHRTDI